MTEALRVRRLGERGPVVALIHGWGWDSRVLLPLAEALSAHAQVVLPDLPGYGLNRDRRCADFDACVDLLASTVPDADSLVGWSLGGLLAIAWAGRAPVRRLALVGASPRFMQAADWPLGMADERFHAFADGVREDARKTRTRFAALAALGDSDARGVRGTLAAWVDDQPPTDDALVASLDWLSQRDERAALNQLECPVALLHGEQDQVIAAGAACAAAEQAGAAWMPVPGAAHLPWRPEAADRLARWLVGGREESVA